MLHLSKRVFFLKQFERFQRHGAGEGIGGEGMSMGQRLVEALVEKSIENAGSSHGDAHGEHSGSEPL